MAILFYWLLLLLRGEFIGTVIGLLIINWLFEEEKSECFFDVHDNSDSKLSRLCPIMQPNLDKDGFMPRDLSVL